MKLAVFHYHLLPGGVTQVITSSVISMLKFIPDIEEVILVSGRKDNTENVSKKIEEETGKKVKVLVIPETGYISDYPGSIDSTLLASKLLNRFEGSIWWIHNYQLGKNPVFTDALLKIAEKVKSQKMIFQIHDFPECARYEYVRDLKETTGNKQLYPVSGNIRYAVINSRDRKVLSASGIPDKLIYTLYNPVTEVLENPDIEQILEIDREMDSFFRETEKSYLPERPVFIYPVRSIRRKNVLEAGFLTRLLPEPVNLFVTLPGISDTERRYSKQVERAFEEKLIPGVFASGIKGDDGGFGFKRQIAASSAVISSSVQEGFGYLYINTVLWKKPLIARSLDIMSDILEILPEENTSFYSKIMVPVCTDEKNTVTEAYRLKIKELADILPPPALENLEKQLSAVADSDFIDYSYLTVDMQISFLAKLKDSGFRAETAYANREIVNRTADLTPYGSTGKGTAAFDRFSLESHAETVYGILKSFNEDSDFSTREDINQNILTTFAKIDYLRLVYDFY